MSLSYKRYGVVGEPLNKGVTQQLKKRREIVLKRNNRTPDDISYLTSNTGWCKVTSAVDISLVPDEYTNIFAENFQLFGGIYSTYGPKRGYLQNTDNSFGAFSSYTESDIQGIVPMPGITSFQVNSLGTYGTLRGGSFSFTVHSTEQFNILEQLYLRPGFNILMEWGHSSFVDNDGSYNNTTQYYRPESFLSSKKEEDLRKELFDLRQKNSYNYDYFYGVIKNFIWSYNGASYECQVDVITKGEIISSLSFMYSSIFKKSKEENYTSTENASQVESILKTLSNSGETSALGDSPNVEELKKEIKVNFETQIPKKYSEALKDAEYLIGYFPANQSNRAKTSLKYITLRDFFKIVNISGLLQDKDGNNLVSFFTGTENSPAFTTFSDHVALDPYICLLGGKTSEINYDITKQAKNAVSDDILNIFINVEYILNLYESLRKSEQAKGATVFTLVNSLLAGIQKNLGDINDFYLHYDEDSGQYFTVDRKVIPSEGDFAKDPNDSSLSAESYIDTVGLGSEVENLKIESKLSGNLTSMIAIAAQGSSGAGNESDIYNVQQWNSGLRDRHGSFHKDLERTGSLEEDVFEVNKETREEFIKFVNTVNDKINDLIVDIPQEEFTAKEKLHKDLTAQLLKQITVSKKTNYPGLIPFELSFTMKGISGMKIAQAFKINEFFLPIRYKGKVAFVITGLDHSISNNKWTTNIKTQIIFLR